MMLSDQLTWGSLYLGVCFLVEILFLVACTILLRKFDNRFGSRSLAVQAGGMITIALVFIVLAHTIQVWMWAFIWVHGDTMEDWNSALYFSMVTYTTLGYGDIVLEPELRIFAAFSAIAGLLAFGLSTAYLVALMSTIFKEHLTEV
ncbi:potassium channel family protein [Ruegeria sp. 2012CJ41-6]|uniref:Potassium channel family protein n=1 Tax=Ruegeria spongiae TaxID=2942209 RepID=A0ABT0PWU0_9RHOB|nr:ion channel [Ruegeria spongiae]MCL6282071.1 potassium channel family protein [Ruegeria spongiae]